MHVGQYWLCQCVMQHLSPTVSEEDGHQLSPTVIAAVVTIIIGGVAIATIILVVGLLVLWRYRRHAGQRGFSWNVKKNEPVPLHNCNAPPDVHVDASGDTQCPQLHRQYGIPNGSPHQQSKDALDQIYNYLQASAASGLSALSDCGTISNPPSPAVSDISNSNKGHHSPYLTLYQLPYSPTGSHHSQHSEHSHHSGKTHATHHSNHSNRSNRSSRSGQSDHSRHSKGSHTYLDDDAGSHYSGSHAHRGAGVGYDHAPRHHSQSPRPRQSRSRLAKNTSMLAPEDDEGSHYRGSHTHLHKGDRSYSLSASLSPSIHKYRLPDPNGHSYHYSSQANRLKRSEANSRSSQSKHSRHNKNHESPTHLGVHDHTPRHRPQSLQQLWDSQSRFWSSSSLVPPGRVPMRSSRSDEHVKHVAPSHVPPPRHPHSAKRHLVPPTPVAGYTHEPDGGDGGGVIDKVLLTAVGCLMHQENCRIPRCPCRQVKERFRHLLPQTRSYMQKEAGKVMEGSSRGEFDPTDRRQQMRLSLTSQNISGKVHPHYHMTSHSHIRQSRGMRRVLQRKRSRSVDLTPVAEQPESSATTPGIVISQATTPSGEQLKKPSPTTPSVTQLPPVLLREISLSADNLPSLCLNDCPKTYTIEDHHGKHRSGGTPCDSTYESGYGTISDHADTETGPLRSHHPPCDRPILPKLAAKVKPQNTSMEASDLLIPSYAQMGRAGYTHTGLANHESGGAASTTGQLKNLHVPAQDRIVPPCVKPTATLPHCTSQGIEYNDEWNDFTLKIPQGAIPEGESLTIDIGVALYGPFQYPEGLRPVSPVFWICVRDKKYFNFLKPVEVTLPHFLTLDGEEDVQSLGLIFLKGDHEIGWKQKTHFQQAEGTALFRPGSDYGVLHTHHFCYLCITSKKSKETIRKAKFCMFATIPRRFSTHKPTYAFFFVTFFLKTCLETIRQQIRNTPELPTGSFQEVKQVFQFAGDVSDPALEIEIPQQHPAGWTLGLEFNTKVIC